MSLIDDILDPNVPASALVPPPAPATLPAPTLIEVNGQTVNAAAKARIDAGHAALVASGAVQASAIGFHEGRHGENEQCFENGHETDTNAAGVYLAQERARGRPAPEVIDDLAHRIEGEGRADVEVSCKEFARSLHMDGRLTGWFTLRRKMVWPFITSNGLAVQGEALRQALSRAGDGAGSSAAYVVGTLGTRIKAAIMAGEAANKANDRGTFDAAQAIVAAEKARLLEIAVHELERSDEVLLLRTRTGSVKDVYAVVSPSYGEADFPRHVANLRGALGTARSESKYNAETTAWDVRAQVVTPTRAQEVAVGEPLRAGMSVRGADNGRRPIISGGFVELVRCCNFTRYTVKLARKSRAHRGASEKVVAGVAFDAQAAGAAVDALCTAWGVANVRGIAAPDGFVGTDRELAAGAFRAALRTGHLKGALPGRTENILEALLDAFDGERRVTDRLVVGDLVQAATRYSQRLSEEDRAEIDQLSGEWLIEHAGAIDGIENVLEMLPARIPLQFERVGARRAT